MKNRFFFMMSFLIFMPLLKAMELENVEEKPLLGAKPGKKEMVEVFEVIFDNSVNVGNNLDFFKYYYLYHKFRGTVDQKKLEQIPKKAREFCCLLTRIYGELDEKWVSTMNPKEGRTFQMVVLNTPVDITRLFEKIKEVPHRKHVTTDVDWDASLDKNCERFLQNQKLCVIQ